MSQLTDRVVSSAAFAVERVIMQMLPKPTCAEKVPRWKDNVAEVKKALAAKLNPQGGGVTITI